MICSKITLRLKVLSVLSAPGHTLSPLQGCRHFNFCWNINNKNQLWVALLHAFHHSSTTEIIKTLQVTELFHKTLLTVQYPGGSAMRLTLIPLTWKIWWAPNNASRWQMGFNSAFKVLTYTTRCFGQLKWCEVHCEGCSSFKTVAAEKRSIKSDAKHTKLTNTGTFGTKGNNWHTFHTLLVLENVNARIMA